tara:strand:- start:42 stop:482 length:441 start_codon:yes stop_codon:yes gene_type:complete
MSKGFKLRKIIQKDSKFLLEWRNKYRDFFIITDEVSLSQHEEYIKKTINDSNRTQYMLEYNNIKFGTIREDIIGDNEFELSYTVNPNHQSKGIGKIMIELYLSTRKGSFLCRIKEKNYASIKLIEKIGFKILKSENKINFYTLTKF